jgi:hypothetical protein
MHRRGINSRRAVRSFGPRGSHCRTSLGTRQTTRRCCTIVGTRQTARRLRHIHRIDRSRSRVRSTALGDCAGGLRVRFDRTRTHADGRRQRIDSAAAAAAADFPSVCRSIHGLTGCSVASRQQDQRRAARCRPTDGQGPRV